MFALRCFWVHNEATLKCCAVIATVQNEPVNSFKWFRCGFISTSVVSLFSG